MKLKIKFSICILSMFITLSCIENNKQINDKSIETLNSRIKSEQFEEIYDNSYSIMKSTISKSEFVKKMKQATNKMKEVDENLDWRKAEHTTHDWTDHTEEYSSRYMEVNGKRVSIEMWWADQQLCHFDVSSNFGETQDIFVARGCD